MHNRGRRWIISFPRSTQSSSSSSSTSSVSCLKRRRRPPPFETKAIGYSLGNELSFYCKNLVTSATAPKASSSSSSDEAIALLTSIVDPSDAALALSIISNGEEKFGGVNPIQACNSILMHLAKSDDILLLEKAFAYLGRMRSKGVRVIPSLAVRNELIRACGRATRRHVRYSQEEDDKGRVFSSSAASSSETSPDVARYQELAESLFEETVTRWEATQAAIASSAAAAPSTSIDENEFSEAERQASPDERHRSAVSMTVSSMIYAYTQAGAKAQALAVYEKMYGMGIKPDKWAAAGLVKAVASDGQPEEALALLYKLQQQEIEVFHHAGLYSAIVSAASGQLLDTRFNSLRSKDLRTCLYTTMSLMRSQGNLRPNRTMWHRVMKAEAMGGRAKDVEAAMRGMREDNHEVMAAEYSILIDALGKADDVVGLDALKGKMKKEGIAFDRVMYLCFITAYGKCRQAEKAKQMFEEMVQVGLTPTLAEYTTMMKALSAAGRHEDAWQFFQGSLPRRPDAIMYSLGLRTALQVGGVDLMEKTYQQFKKEIGEKRRRGPAERKVLNSMMAGYADVGQVDKVYELLDEMKKTPGVKPSIASYNVLIHGLAKQGKTDEAMRVAEEAQAEGLKWDSVTFKGLVKSAGDLVSIAEDLWEAPPGVYRSMSLMTGEDGRTKLTLDVHGLSVAETIALLSREFKAMRAAADLPDVEEEEEREGKGKAMGERKERTSFRGLRDMSIITGYKKRRRSFIYGNKAADNDAATSKDVGAGGGGGGGEAILKEVVRDFLSSRGIYHYHPPQNPGRFEVPRAAFRDYFERQKKSESETRFLRLSLFRYIPVASLIALFFVIPNVKDVLP